MAVKEGGADNRAAIRTTQNYWHWALQTLSREDSENYIRWNARKGCWQCLDLDDEVDRGITTRKVMSTTWEKNVEGSSLESLNASLGDRLDQLLGKAIEICPWEPTINYSADSKLNGSLCGDSNFSLACARLAVPEFSNACAEIAIQ